ncbi:MAG: L,D-transpeptidase [Syntrophobacteraceae bacterium]|nr:L,D-transpeptidase [Syntrophobacteraceae bacterium]
MRLRTGLNGVLFVLSFQFLSGCAVQPIDLQQAMEFPPPEQVDRDSKESQTRDPRQRGVTGGRWSERVITEREVQKICERDPDLTPVMCYEILGRLNSRARYYIPDDIKAKKRMRVPHDFKAYKNWSPLPRQIQATRNFPKFILIVKDIPFIGWYQNGRMIQDTQICIGKEWGWTKKGLYRVEEKDIDHVSGSYPNAYGEPAPMPFALRIYSRVWIHAGDVVGGFCSHGCINLPLTPAEKLFNWADMGTAVLVLDSLKELDTELKRSGVIKKSG